MCKNSVKQNDNGLQGVKFLFILIMMYRAKSLVKLNPGIIIIDKYSIDIYLYDLGY